MKRFAVALSWLEGTGAGRQAPGIAASLLLHGLAAAIIAWMMLHRAANPPQPLPRLVPIDLVPLGEETTAPPAEKRAPAPRSEAMKGAASAPKPEGVRPHAAKPEADSFELRLRNLAQLRQPEGNLRMENGASNDTATGDGAAGPAAYGVRDYIRAQVLRRWDFDLGQLGERQMRIGLHIVITGRGTVANVEIDDLSRHKNDAAWRDIAIAARNAVLLSSPFQLPASLEGKGLDFTLTLDPHDTLR